jgi:hypothetical protein
LMFGEASADDGVAELAEAFHGSDRPKDEL